MVSFLLPSLEVCPLVPVPQLVAWRPLRQFSTHTRLLLARRQGFGTSTTWNLLLQVRERGSRDRKERRKPTLSDDMMYCFDIFLLHFLTQSNYLRIWGSESKRLTSHQRLLKITSLSSSIFCISKPKKSSSPQVLTLFRFVASDHFCSLPRSAARTISRS